MGKLISFEELRMKRRAKPPKRDFNTTHEIDIEASIVATIAKDLASLKESVLGLKFSCKDEKSKLKQFFFNAFVQKLRSVKAHFLAYTYLSELLSDPKRVAFTYAIDMIMARNEKGNVSNKDIADNCFVIASLWPDWLNRKGNPMGRDDYLGLASSFYWREATIRLDGSRPLYEDLSINIAIYSDVVLEVRRSLIPS